MITSLRTMLRSPGRLVRRMRRQRRIHRLARRRPCRVVIGASGMIPAGWIGTEIDDVDLLRPQTWERFFCPGSIDALLAEHVWEHLTAADGVIAAATCFQFLKAGGYLRLAVPDGLHPDPAYIENVRPQGTGPGASDHRVLYNHDSLRTVFEQAGFQVKLLEHFDEKGQFHFEPWDEAAGMIRRSSRFDSRNADGKLHYTSIVLDAVKPVAAGSPGV